MPKQLIFPQDRRVYRLVLSTLAVLFVLNCAPRCAGQQPTATAVFTDLAVPPVSGQFGVPNQFKLTGAGDVYFTSGGNTGLFRWSQPAGIERLLQTNDPIGKLGIPILPTDGRYAGALLDATGGLLQANAGNAAFIVSLAIKGSEDSGAAFVYDGSSFRLPFSGGVTSFSQLFLNAGGKVAVAGKPGYWNRTNPQRIFVETDSGRLLVAETGQTAPGGTGTFGNFPVVIGFNDNGQVAFLAETSGNSRALFLFDGTRVQLVAKSQGDPENFAFVTATPANYGNQYALNNAGQVAFRTGTSGAGAGLGIWIGDASGVSNKLMRTGEATGIEGWGNYGTPTLRGFNDAGEVLFDCNTTSGPGYALFLKKLDDAAPKVVFSAGQSGGSAGNFQATQQASLNNAGNVAFLTTLTGGSSPIGWYLGSGATDPALIVAQGDSTPLGGAFGLAGRSTPAVINAAGQVLFLADIRDLNVVGLFRWTNDGGVIPVISTMDSLPDAANTVLRAVPASTSDTETLARVLKAGGQATFYAKKLDVGMPEPRKIVAEFDQVPDAGTVVDLDNLSMNNKGEVVFTAALLGSDSYPRSGILANLPDSGLKKVVLTGDSVPAGGTFTLVGAPQLNNQSQIAFYASTRVDFAPVQGIFIASDAAGVQAVARQRDTLPGGGAFNGFVNGVALNDSGQVAFRGLGSGNASGLFVGSGGGTPLRVAGPGTVVAGGVGIANLTNTAIQKLNAAGQIAFFANLAGSGGNSGIFLGTPGATEYTLKALAIQKDPAPGAGSQFWGFREDSIDLNGSGQVAFWANLCCSGVMSGWFLGSATDPLSPRLLENQPLPGGGRSAAVSDGARFAALADSGEMAIYVAQNTDNATQPQLVIAGVDGALRRLVLSGETAEGTGSEFAKLFPTLLATPSGRFLFGAVLVNGPATAGIFIDKP